MKKTLTYLCAAVVCAWMMGASAQAAPASHAKAIQQSSQSGQSGQSSSHEYGKERRRVTLSGCVQEGTTPGTFVLTNVENETPSKSGKSSMSSSEQQEQQTGTSGQMKSEQAEQSKMDFQLTGNSKIDKELKQYVGQRVQIRGDVEPMNDQPQGTSGMSGQSGEQTTAGPITHRVRVNSVKKLSGGSCK